MVKTKSQHTCRNNVTFADPTIREGSPGQGRQSLSGCVTLYLV